MLLEVKKLQAHLMLLRATEGLIATVWEKSDVE